MDRIISDAIGIIYLIILIALYVLVEGFLGVYLPRLFSTCLSAIVMTIAAVPLSELYIIIVEAILRLLYGRD